MKLTDLDATFVRYGESLHEVDTTSGKRTIMLEREIHVVTLGEAQGIRFQCPRCFSTSGHYVGVSFEGRGVPDHLGSQGRNGKPSRWTVSGTGIEDLSLSPSIDISESCGWHGFVTNGVAS